MSLSTILQGEVFTVRTYKQYVGFAWANNYEVEATQDISNPSTELEFLANRIVELEKNLHLSGILLIGLQSLLMCQIVFLITLTM